ncbi:MAG: CPBP family intramembrane metalloprotease [Candidatus Eremiobacteraeota bacterium]|nr:CPBP family intramembrane metalloprotease [Candidatus Eremiobacteraeota bacterium]
MPHATILTIITLLILIIALPLLSLWTGKRIRAAVAAPTVKYLRYARTVVILWSLTALALYALRLHNLEPTYVGLRPPRHIAELAFGLLTLLAPLLAHFSGARRVLEGDYARALRAVVPAGAAQWIAFIPVAASAGICEEFLYRGYALTILSSLTGSVVAGALLSSIAFGAGHAYQGRSGVVGATITGLLYAIIFLATGSLYPCMLGHFVQDIAGAAVLSRRLEQAGPPQAAADTRATVWPSSQ